MRNYRNFDRYLNKLEADLYPQPPDDLQQKYGEEMIDKIIQITTGTIRTVLDVGCGQGQFAQKFRQVGIPYSGVTLGTDVDICIENGLDVWEEDFSFLESVLNKSFDLIFSRHSLEHSPFPLLTLMEWYRVSKKYLCVILPNPLGFISESHVGAYRGRNHYSVMTKEHFIWLANRAGWHLIYPEINNFEMRFLLVKGKEIIE